jgi:S-methylmethionine-dependent homocysteine/selenocysteine methylase
MCAAASSAAFLDRLHAGPPLLLDGATGTELLRRGYRTELPLWSAGALLAAPHLVRAIHADYVAAGAEVITTNTFRTNVRALERAGLRGRSRALTRVAVELARSVGPAFVAGSIAPVEDCYRPDLTPTDAELHVEHSELARHLAEAGCDVLLIETMNSIREARIALAAAAPTGLPRLVGFVCSRTGLLLSGEDPKEAARAASAAGAIAVLVNCTPLPAIPAILDRMRSGTTLPLGAYANVGAEDPVVGWRLTEDVEPGPYAAAARTWIEHGARLIGGCCGTRPDHIRQMAEMVCEQRRSSPGAIPGT